MKIKSCFGSFRPAHRGNQILLHQGHFAVLHFQALSFSSFNNFKLGIADSIIAGLSLYLGIPFDHQPESGNFEMATLYAFVCSIDNQDQLPL